MLRHAGRLQLLVLVLLQVLCVDELRLLLQRDGFAVESPEPGWRIVLSTGRSSVGLGSALLLRGCVKMVALRTAPDADMALVGTACMHGTVQVQGAGWLLARLGCAWWLCYYTVLSQQRFRALHDHINISPVQHSTA